MSESIRVMISEEDVDKRIRELASDITKDYMGEEITLVIILKGAAFFGCEIAKRIETPVVVDFMATSSYESGTESSGTVVIKKELDHSVENKNVIIVEDIIDSGNTLHALSGYFQKRGAKSVKLCTLLDKPDRRQIDIKVDYLGFTIPNEFVVGYGLDYAQKYRNLPYIGVVEFDS